MKKNRAMRIAALLLVLTMMTSCFVGGTFAKYTTKGDSVDTARVAKFDVTVTGSNDIFDDWYPTHDTSLTTAEAAIVGAQSVVSSNGDNRLAPGTDGDLANFTITGTPEVAVRVSYKLTDWTHAGWEIGSEEYFPIIITVDTTDYFIDYAHGETIEEFLTRVAGVIDDYTEVYEAGTVLDTQYATSLYVSWRWDFESDTATLGSYQTDEKDTALGDEGNAAFTMTVTATVDQID